MMKKFVFTAFAYYLIVNAALAQCTPDDSIRTTGIFPALLDTATINEPYNQIIQYYITRDTNVVFGGSTINAIIDSITITGVKGMPAGLTYACHNATCTSPGGKTGCVTISGTPTQSGIFPITVYITIRARAFLGPIPVGQTVNDSNSRYFIAVKPLPVGVQDNYLNNHVTTYQSDKRLHIISNNLSITGCELKDISGKTVASFEKFNLTDTDKALLDVSNLKAGIYLVYIQTNQGAAYKKVFIE